MKLIKLEILNLASLDNPHGETINFEDGALKNCTIFSIVGSTGSGKSTILDAICLALYGRTPRYPRQSNERSGKIEIYGESDNDRNKRLATTDCRNILTRGKNDGYSKLTFLANNGYLYRAEWYIHFNRTRFEDAKKNLYCLKPQDNGSYIEEELEWNSITQIIGLDYEQFLRTVLLAQGSFANFLTTNENDRYELLEKLIGCKELYTAISSEIKTRKDAAKKYYDEISASVVAFQQNILKPDELTALIAEIEHLEASKKAVESALKQIEICLKWYDDEKRKSENIAICQANDEKATAALKEIEEDIKLLSRFDSVQPALDLLRDINGLEDNIKSNNQTITEKREDEKKKKSDKEIKEGELDNLKNIAKTTKEEQEKFAPIIANARKIEGQIKESEKHLNDIKTQQKEVQKEKTIADDDLSQNKKDIELNCKAIATAIEQFNTTKEQIEQQLDKLLNAQTTAEENLKVERAKIEGIDADKLLQDKNLADQKFDYAKDAQKLVNQYISDNTEKEEKEKEQQRLEEANKRLTEQLNSLTIEELEQQYNTTRDAYTLITSENWVQHRTQLKSDEPCPLCGAIHHPYCDDITKVETISHELKDLCDSIETNLNEQKKNRNEWQTQKSTNEGILSGLENQLKKLHNSLAETKDKWEQLRTTFSELQSYSISDKAAIEALVLQLEANKTTADKSLSAYNNIQKEIERLQKLKDEADKTLSDYKTTSEKQLEKDQNAIDQLKEKEVKLTAATPILQKQLAEKTEDLQTITEQLNKQEDSLNSLQQQLKDMLQGKDPDTFEQELKTKTEQAESAVKRKEEEIQGIIESLKKLEGELTTLQNQLTQNQSKLDQTNTSLTNWINLYNLSNPVITLDDIHAIYNSNCDWDDIRKNKETLQNDKTSAATLLANAQKEHEEHQKSRPQKSQEELKQEQESLNQQNYTEQLVIALAKQKNHNDAEEALGTKAEELKKATKEHNNWTAINDAIGGDGKTLRKIAQCYTLSFLVEYANNEIRRFNSRYELVHVKNSLGIRVIDHDRADDIRDTTSLSGGETFIVSLGLALGLSTLSSRNISFDNLFIDEGFGTLDPDALATVIDSLAMLQSSQGKKVCVISHTDTMSERITTQIRVIKTGSGSSRIEIHS